MDVMLLPYKAALKTQGELKVRASLVQSMYKSFSSAIAKKYKKGESVSVEICLNELKQEKHWDEDMKFFRSIGITDNMVRNILDEIIKGQVRVNSVSIAGTTTSTSVPNKPVPIQKVGRNELCPCGSGKKFKKCCGK